MQSWRRLLLRSRLIYSACFEARKGSHLSMREIGADLIFPLSPHTPPHPEVPALLRASKDAPQARSCFNLSMTGAWVYILKCADGSYYTGLTKQELPEAREQQHNEGTFPDAYTFTTRPVKLVYAEYLDMVIDAIESERRIKGWSKAKKEALIAGDWERVQTLAKRRGGR